MNIEQQIQKIDQKCSDDNQVEEQKVPHSDKNENNYLLDIMGNKDDKKPEVLSNSKLLNVEVDNSVE